MKNQSKLVSFVLGISLVGLGLSGCTTVNTQPNDDGMAGMDHGSMHSMSITDKQSFAEAMIPHHQQAVDMSEFAVTNTSNPEILAFASKITSEQGPEIEKMTPWLEGKAVDFNMMMNGMLSPVQLAALRTAKDGNFDKLYAQYMIQHHEGAVEMAADAIRANDPELTEFASQIIVTQSAEIEELMALLKN